MRKFIIPVFLVCVVHTSFSQETSKVVPIDQDSLKILYSQIDKMHRPHLMKLKEHFTYRNKIEPSLQNKQLLLYVEEKLLTVQE